MLATAILTPQEAPQRLLIRRHNPFSSVPRRTESLSTLRFLLLIAALAPAPSFGRQVPAQSVSMALPRGSSAMTFEISQPKQPPESSFFTSLPSRKSSFLLEISHFLILACFPGQQSCSPALPAIQQRSVECCHGLCAFAILLSVPALHAAGVRAVGVSSFNSGHTLTQRMLCHCGTC